MNEFCPGWPDLGIEIWGNIWYIEGVSFFFSQYRGICFFQEVHHDKKGEWTYTRPEQAAGLLVTFSDRTVVFNDEEEAVMTVRDANGNETEYAGNGLTAIRAGAFQNCESLTQVILPQGFSVIAENAFNGCAALQSISLPDSVTAIGMQAFSGCEALEQITLSANLNAIGDSSFSGCDNVVIHAPEGSYAYAWAKLNHIPVGLKTLFNP